MARKKKSRTKQANKRSPEDTARAAAAHLEQERFKDAATDYKQLLKDERRAEWVEGLASAYAGRAAQLAERGMVKEAIALWQNRAEACDTDLADPRYLQWLIAADRTREIARLYRQDATALAGAGGLSVLQARLAAAALADGGALIEQLPAHDPVVRDFTIANTALIAYADGDDETVQTELGRIAFRSPYRDFRQLLKALIQHETDPAAAAERVARVPADTPFLGMLQALKTAGALCAPTPPDATTLAAVDTRVHNLLAALAGWSSAQHPLVARLARLGAAPTRKALFDFVIAHRKALGTHYARVAAYMLAGEDARMHRRLAKIYHTVAETELSRLLALTLEASGMLGDALGQWQRMVELLASEPARDADSELRRALIHRHIADMLQPRSASLELEPQVIAQLTASLALDPLDRDSTLRLLDHYLYVGDLKAARAWGDQALAQYPGDPGCLFRAAETAIASNAYKKAARLAERILAVDSINAGARGLLVDAYLGHARKQIKANKPDAARREIDNAAGYARSAIDTTQAALLNALATFAHDGAKAAATELGTSVARADDPLIGRFLLLLEAARTGQNLAAVERAARLPAIKTLGERAHVLALMDALGGLRSGQQHSASTQAALSKLAPALNQAASIRLDRGRAEQVCEMLLRYRQYGPLKRYAQTALKRWPDEPLFVFYRIMGHRRGERILPWDKEARQLDAAFERADDAGDQRTAERIYTVLNEMMPPLGDPDYFDPFEDDIEPDPALDSIPTLLDGELNPILQEIFAQFLGSADMGRLETSVQRDGSVPADISAKIQAFLAADDREPPLPAPRGASGARKRRSTQHNDNQGDFFGGNS